MARYLCRDESNSKNLAVTDNLVADSRDWGSYLCGYFSLGSLGS